MFMGMYDRTEFATVARNSLAGFTGKATVKLLSFAFNILIIRWLGDAGYGQYVLIWSFVTVFAMFSDAGLGMYAIREIARNKPGSRTLTANVIVLRLILAGLVMLVIGAAARLAGYSDTFLAQIILASSILLFYAVQDPLDSLLQGRERFDLATTAVLAGQLAFMAAGVVVLWLGGGITGLIVAALFNVAVSAGAAYGVLGPNKQWLQWNLAPKRWPGFFQSALWFGLVKVWLSWSLRVDLVILSWFWAANVVGWYGAAYTLILGLITLPNAINSAFYPSFSRRSGQDDRPLTQTYQTGLKYLMVIALPLAVGVFFTRAAWVQLFFGPRFAPTSVILGVLVWVLPLAFASEFMRYILLADRREKEVVAGLGAAVVLNVGLNLWLAPIYGPVAAAAIAVATEGLLVLLYIRQLKPQLAALNVQHVLFKPALAALVMAVVLWSLPASLPLQLIAGSAVFLAAIWLLKIITPPEQQMLRRTITAMARRVSFVGRQKMTTSMPLVSIFIPVYNGEAFIGQAIDSVLGQTYSNFELIVIDDGSTDGTARIIERYKTHPNVRILHNPANLGVSPTWNIGVKLCRGKLIAKLDADDYYSPRQLETVVHTFNRHPQVGLIFSGLTLRFPNGHTEPDMPFLRSWVRKRAEFLPTLLRLCVVRAPTAFVNSQCYDALGGVVEGMKIHSDWELWVRIAANYPVAYLARRMSTYRTSYGANITAQAAVDGRSMHDLKLWLDLLAAGKLPYTLSDAEEQIFRQGAYELEMHFAALASWLGHTSVERAYVEFAEKKLLNKPDTPETQRMRRVYLNLHQGLHAFRANRHKEARQLFLNAIKAGPAYCTAPWIWNKLLLTFTGRTKWGILYK